MDGERERCGFETVFEKGFERKFEGRFKVTGEMEERKEVLKWVSKGFARRCCKVWMGF